VVDSGNIRNASLGIAMTQSFFFGHLEKQSLVAEVFLFAATKTEREY
jgi:hypothetical protein